MRRIIFVYLWLGMVLFWAQSGQAWLDRISVSVSGGAGYVSLEDWEDFWSTIGNSKYEKDKLGTFLESRVVYHLSSKHALALNVENIRTEAALYYVMSMWIYPGGEDTLFIACLKEWCFSAVPAGLSYEYYPKGSEKKVSPFFGVGVSYFFSEVEAKGSYLQKERFGPTSRRTRKGEGYGLHLYVGVQSKLAKHLLIFSRVRGRYADGMAFTDKKGAIKVEFTGVDFTMGLGWRF